MPDEQDDQLEEVADWAHEVRTLRRTFRQFREDLMSALEDLQAKMNALDTTGDVAIELITSLRAANAEQTATIAQLQDQLAAGATADQLQPIVDQIAQQQADFDAVLASPPSPPSGTDTGGGEPAPGGDISGGGAVQDNPDPGTV